ncbi:MAG TPA: hypothetical protein PLW65_16025, partial [Pseudomonadota bacterium]|nr:hypothetical protein [Pseudomonadota bacterium]
PFVPHTGQMLYTGLVTLAAGLAGMLLTYRLLRRHFAGGAALAGAVTAVVLTPQLWYLTIQPHYQHGLAFAAVALFMERWDRQRGSLRPRRFFALGVLGGVAMLMRAQEVVFLLAPVLELVLALVRGGARPGRRIEATDLGAARAGQRAGAIGLCAGVLGVGVLLGFLPQLAVWGAYFGWFVRPPNIETLRPLQPAIVEVLWSMRAGLFPWTPVAYLGCAGLGLGLRRRGDAGVPAEQQPAGGRTDRRGLLAAAVVILLADVYLVASSWVFYGGFSFGARRLADCAGLLGMGVAELWAAVGAGPGWWRRLARAGLWLGLCMLAGLNLTLVELVRQRRLPDSGAAAWPAYRLAQRAGGPQWLVALLRRGYPFVQPAGLLFALRHQAPLTAWEGVVGNYALEEEAHDRTPSGVTWDFTGPQAELFTVEGLSAEPANEHGRLIGPRVRVLLQPFAEGAIACALEVTTAGPTELPAAGSATGSVKGSTAGSTAGSTELPAAGSVTGSVTGSTAGSTAGSTGSAGAGSVTGSTAGLAELSTARSTAGSTGSAGAGEGELEPEGLVVMWNGRVLATRRQGARTLFTLPAAEVRAHAVGELVLLRPAAGPPARLRRLQLTALRP